MVILPFLGLSKGRLVSLLRAALGRASHRDTKTRRQETSRRGFALWERRGRLSWRKPLTETQRHGEKFLPTALPSPSSPCFQLCLLRSRSCRPSGCLQQGWFAFPPERLTLRAALYAAYRTTALLLGSQPAPAGMCSAFQHFPSCLMYAGFKRIAPDQDTGMDLNEPWITALELFHVGKRSECS